MSENLCPEVPIKTSEGNTESSAVSIVNDKTLIKNYCITIKKSNCAISALYSLLSDICDSFVFQEEIGEGGFNHYQCYCEFKIKYRFTTLQNKYIIFKDAHFEKRKGSREQAINYCCKIDNTTVKGTLNYKGFNGIAICPVKKIDPDILCFDNLRDFQKEILNIIYGNNGLIKSRVIHWFYDDGNTGKTELIKFILKNYKSFYCSNGKSSDILNLAFNTDMNFENFTVCINYPRNTKKENINYNILEQLKDGLINNTKYETGFKIIPSPHIVVMANCMPMVEALTIDRWNIYKIDNSILIKEKLDFFV